MSRAETRRAVLGRIATGGVAVVGTAGVSSAASCGDAGILAQGDGSYEVLFEVCSGWTAEVIGGADGDEEVRAESDRYSLVGKCGVDGYDEWSLTEVYNVRVDDYNTDDTVSVEITQ